MARINKIESINCMTIKKRDIADNSVATTIKIHTPKTVEIMQDSVDIKQNHVSAYRKAIYVADLFSDGTEIVIEGLFSLDNGRTTYGKWNMLTGDFTEIE